MHPHRMAGNLADAGIVYKWNVESCGMLPWLDAANALPVLRIFQEAIGNALTHSGTTTSLGAFQRIQYLCPNDCYALAALSSNRILLYDRLPTVGDGKISFWVRRPVSCPCFSIASGNSANAVPKAVINVLCAIICCGFKFCFERLTAMSFKYKNIALSAAAILLVVGGTYSVLSDRPDAISTSAKTVEPAPAKANPPPSGAKIPVNTHASQHSNVPASMPPAQPVAPVQKKLTKQQLTPPPVTEDEKLQKAAEQESNF